MNWGVEAAGWTGAGLILGSYILVSLGRLEGRSAAFQWMNVAGAAGFMVNSGWHGAIATRHERDFLLETKNPTPLVSSSPH